MKLFILTFIIATNLMSQEINWIDNYQLALKNAQDSNKLVYILITSDSCKWCKKFIRTTLKNEGINTRLNKNFITLHLIRDKNKIPDKFKTSPVPRHYFTNSKGDILYNAIGYRKVECFDSFMDNAEERYKQN